MGRLLARAGGAAQWISWRHWLGRWRPLRPPTRSTGSSVTKRRLVCRPRAPLSPSCWSPSRPSCSSRFSCLSFVCAVVAFAAAGSFFFMVVLFQTLLHFLLHFLAQSTHSALELKDLMIELGGSLVVGLMACAVTFTLFGKALAVSFNS